MLEGVTMEAGFKVMYVFKLCLMKKTSGSPDFHRDVGTAEAFRLVN